MSDESKAPRLVRICAKCLTDMRPGIALAQTYTGIGDFNDRDDVVTLSPGGPGEVIHCWKCPACGWSVTR